jgi:hypothetical protein
MRTASEILNDLDRLRDRRTAKTITEIEYHDESHRLWDELRQRDSADRIEFARIAQEAEDAAREAEKRRRIARLKASGEWYHPVHKTLKAAEAAGFSEMRPEYYGGETITLKGHVLVRNHKWAQSETAWKRSGRRVMAHEPHACVKTQWGQYAVYRDDQTVCLPVKTKRRPVLRIAG